MTDIFNEVDDDLRRDRAEQLWKRYGNYVIAAAAAIVVATAGWVWWTDYQRKQAAAEGEAFFAAAAKASGGDQDGAAAALTTLARDGKSGFAPLALMYEAGLKARKGDAAGSAALYRAVAGDSKVDGDLRDAATLLGALVSVETAPAAEIDGALARITAAKSPWRFTAFEIAAVTALKAGNTARAKEFYARIADDPGAPGSLRARAAEMLQAIGS
ncbi:MAG: tetratricopeptide repeat protein [Alphaproteobacteria bacterium]|nr:tetratricopeptide repeat protein [Alphaproteobacteria bacterium]